MLKNFLNRTARDLVAATSGIPPWLNDPENPFLFTLRLRGVADPLDGDALRDHEYGGGSTIRETRTNRPDRRLRLALDAHRQVMQRHADARGYLVEDPRVYADVLLRIPRGLWRQHRMTASGRIPILLDRLAHRHNQEFQDQLFANRAPRYQVIPADGLSDDEILCQFGLGVFIPDAEDRLRGEVTIRLEGQERSLPEWESLQTGRGPMKRITRAAAIYQDQHYLLLAADSLQAPIQSPLWPQGREGYVLVNLAGEQPELEPEEGPLRGADVQWDTASGAWSCRFEGQEGRGLEVRIRLDAPPTANPGAGPAPASGTIVFAGRRSGPRLVLAGIALPRIDPELMPGLNEWTLRIDPNGLPAPDGATGATLKGKVGDDTLYLRIAGGSRFESLRLPAAGLKAGQHSASLAIDPLPLPDYLGLLRPQHAKEFPIPAAKVGGAIIGRAPAADPAKESAIPLALLNQPGSLLWDDNTTRGSLNDFVSGRFARLFPQGDGLRVEMLSASAPLHILDPAGKYLRTLEPGSGGQVVIASGQHLLLGLYLLRYQASQG
ncbi:MAG: hypothetical protein KJ558_04200 [Gammaproteobacteria bacterium]|nr:hypothetical protein [Gammaproteobacteria bacterium]MBU1654025.1 hypothetical protein [Gammaproteobacteria bacterium]MBU1959694.1 hypothetical protein [Gammaproteobacteria bacterium]